MKNVVINDKTHTLLRVYCSMYNLKMGCFVEELIQKRLRNVQLKKKLKKIDFVN